MCRDASLHYYPYYSYWSCRARKCTCKYVAREGALAGALTMSVLNFNSLTIIAVACPWFWADSADSMDLGN